MAARTAVIGLGNPILSDDSVGIRVSRLLAERFVGKDGVEVLELYAGGIRLMDAMVGYGRVVVIDAMETGAEPGTIRRLIPSDICSTRNAVCSHDMTLATALELGRMLGLELPERVDIWGIEAADVETFGEELTVAVARAVPRVADEICSQLGGVA